MPKKKTFLLRVSPELWDEISRWAADELRSVNGHVEWLLRDAVRRRRGGAPGPGTATPPGRGDRGAPEEPDGGGEGGG